MMNRNQILKTTLTALACSAIVSTSAFGAAISVNFDIAGGNSPSLAPGDVAGVVPSANWNNLAAAGVSQPFNYGMTYVDDSGANTSLTVAASGGASDTWNTAGTPDQIIFGDKLNYGSTTGSLSLSNISYSTYDLYIYSTEWSNESVTFSVGGDNQVLNNTFSGQFGDPAFVQGDTYVKFTGLSGDVVVNMTSAQQLHLGGFQIVDAVPEPSSLALLGLGGLAMVRRRR